MMRQEPAGLHRLRNKVDGLKGYIINYADNIDSYDKNSKEYQLGALYLCAMDADTRNAYCYGTVGNKFLADADRAQNMEELSLSVVVKLTEPMESAHCFWQAMA